MDLRPFLDLAASAVQLKEPVQEVYFTFFTDPPSSSD